MREGVRFLQLRASIGDLSSGASRVRAFVVLVATSLLMASSVGSAWANGASVPDAPSINYVAPGDASLEVSFTAPGSDGGAAIADYKYSTDGTNFLAVGSITSPFTISTLSSDGTTPLTNGTTYSITLKAVNSVGDSQASTAVASMPAIMVNNEKLRFGGGGAGLDSLSVTYVDSVATNGMLEQPFYKSSNLNWYKLTYSTYGLNMTLGSGTGGSNWSGATVPTSGDFDAGNGITSLRNLAVDQSGMTLRSPPKAVDYGYGTLVVTGDVTLNGDSVGVSNTYVLGQNSSYIKITTAITNKEASAIDNVMIWVGTKDDYVGNDDDPTKTRGNLVGGSFQAITDATASSNAIQITSGAEGVLFYSTSPGVETTIDDCCDFADSVRQDPDTAPITEQGDGSYAAVLPVGNLAAGATTSITWYYAAGAIADLGAVAQVVSADAGTSGSSGGGSGVSEGSGDSGSAPAVVVEEEPVVAPPVRTFDPVQQPIPSSSSSAAIRQGPTLLVGGRPSNLQVDVPSSQRLELSEGDLSISLRLPAGAGNIGQQNGTTALSVVAGSTMSFAGSGLRPGTFAQVFLPLGGGQDSVELGRYEIGDDGSFSRPVALDTMPSSSMPIAIGPQVLQIVSYDSDGNQVVLDLLVNVTQPLPAPEFNRSTGEIPGLLPGNSLATRAGIPVPLTVTGLSEQDLVVLEGDGWSIGLNVVNDSGTVESTEGGASVTLVRDKPLEISGTGFMPGTRADVWLFSDPTFVGSAIVTETGEFFAEVLVDSNFVAVGEHTIQLQGIGEDGYVRSANLGVAVGDNILATEAERVYAPWWTLLLIGLGLVLFGSLRRWGPIRGNLAHNLASAAVLFTATPAVVLGWISTVTAISWWGLALGLVALILYRFIRPRHPHLG